jgi:hypothetical protein
MDAGLNARTLEILVCAHTPITPTHTCSQHVIDRLSPRVVSSCHRLRSWRVCLHTLIIGTQLPWTAQNIGQSIASNLCEANVDPSARPVSADLTLDFGSGIYSGLFYVVEPKRDVDAVCHTFTTGPAQRQHRTNHLRSFARAAARKHRIDELSSAFFIRGLGVDA